MPRILLVDDDIAEISAVKRVLARSGHQPVLATNASDAVAAINQLPPDLLVVGSTCENGEALALAGRIARGEAGVPPIPLVLLGEAPGIPEGAAVLPRPVDPAQLSDEVTRALGASRPAEPPAPSKKPQPVGRISTARVPIVPPPPPEPAAPPPAPAPPMGRRATDARPPRASPPPRHDAPAADPRPALSVEVTAALEPVGPRRAAEKPALPPGGADARRAAAEALRARAEELRRSTPAPRPHQPISEEVVDDELDALLDRADERPVSELAAELGTDLDALHAAPGHAAPAKPAARPAPAPAPPPRPGPRPPQARPAARPPAQAAPGAQPAAAAASPRAPAPAAPPPPEPAAQALAEQAAALEAAAQAAAQAAAAEARREAEAKAEAAREEAARAAAEAQHAAEEARRVAAAAEEEARRARDAEARAQAEAEARTRLEQELDALRTQLEAERRTSEERLAEERQRSAATSDAAEELQRLAEEQASARAAEEARRREEQEEELRRAIDSARADMEALRRRNEEEARRRAEVEAELARLTEEASLRAEPPGGAASPAPPAAAAAPTAFAFPEPAIPMPPPADPAEEEARLRALARTRDGEPAPLAAGAEPGAPGPPPLPPPELRSGTIADTPAPRLLALAWKARLTGRLDFQGAAARSIHFEDGRVVGATSAEPSERLEELALRLGLVTRDQYRQIAPSAAALPARRAALLLLERGFLKPNELTGLVRRRSEEIVFGLFADESARFRWVGAEVPPEERVGLDRGTLALAMEGVRRRWLAARLEAVLGGAATLLAPAAGPSAAELALTAEERKVVALADGLRTLDEIVAASPLDPLSARQVLAALVLVGSLTVRVLGAGRAAGAAAAEIDLARVRDKLDQARRADYFTILGVGRLCTPHEVREAADRLAAEFAPARFTGVREDGLPARLEEILRVVADAREVLADERLREEYLKGLGE